MSNVTRCVARPLGQVLPAFYCQDVLSVTSSKIPPGARSLCNYRCKLGVCGKLPDFLPLLPVNNTLPTTFHYLSWFCDLMPVSCGVKRVDVQMKVTVLPKLSRVRYIINLKRRTTSCCGMHRRWKPRVKSKVLIFLCSFVFISKLFNQKCCLVFSTLLSV